MENTTAQQSANALMDRAKDQVVKDMENRGIAAIIWDIATAGFHYIPEVVTGKDKKGDDIVVRITGLYAFRGVLYAIEEGAHGTAISNYYNKEVDVAPTVVTLTEDMALAELGDPTVSKGFTTAGSNAEWLTLGDCYLEALNEQ